MEELEVTALYSLTLMGTQTHTHCHGQNSDKPLNHRYIAANNGSVGHYLVQRAPWHTEGEQKGVTRVCLKRCRAKKISFELHLDAAFGQYLKLGQ